MLKNLVLCLAVFTTTLSLTSTISLAQNDRSPKNNNQQQKESPFLITSELPHLTKLLMQQWDNSTLKLSDEQKTQLLVVRKETMSGVKSLAPQIAPLHKQVTEGVFVGKTPKELSAAVQAISKLKTEATMIHLKCIYDTRSILSQRQLEILLEL